MGGPSAEREVSLMSGREVAGALRRSGFPVDEIDLNPADVDRLAERRFDVAFIALHGTFGEDGTVSGSSGCNTFSGTYTADDSSIELGPAASTQKMCAAEGVMEQEEQFLAALAASSIYEIRGHRLQLRNADGALQVDLSR